MTNSPGLNASEPLGSARLNLLFAFLLALATIGLYSPMLEGSLVYDDLPLIEGSPATQSVSAALDNALEPFWAFNNPDASEQRGIWRPLTSLALALGRALNGSLGETATSGSPGSAAGFHWMSLLLHLGAVLGAFRFACLLLSTRTGLSGSRASIAAGLAALLFAWHPAQVEAVAWISAVNDPLWGLFGILSLLAYERSALRGRAPLAAAALFFLALTAKEQALVLPVIALCLDWTARRRPKRSALLMLALPVALWIGLRVWVFGSADAGLLRDYGDFGLAATREFTFRIELAGGFIANLFWPASPAVFRPVHPVLPEGSAAVLHGALWMAGLGLTGLFAAWRGMRSVAFGLLAAAIVFLPFVASPDKAGLFPESDRYLYLAVFGAALAVIGGLARLKSTAPMALVALAVAGAFAKVSYGHQARFESELAFRDAAVEDAPTSPNVRWGAGRAYIAEYQRTQDVDLLAQAYLHYLHSLKAVTIYGDGSFVDDPKKPLAERVARMEHLILETPPDKRRLDPTVFATADDRYQATLGQVYSNLLRVDVSENPDFEYPLLLVDSAAQLWGDRPELASLQAQIHLRRGELQPAKEAIARAMQKAPGNVGFLAQLGEILMREGDFDGARATFKRALEFSPDDVDITLDYALAALESGRLESAEEATNKVLEGRDPKNVRALLIRGASETRRGRPSEALRYLDRALAVDPEFGRAHKERGLAMYKLNDVEGMLESFSNAARLLPEDFESHYNVASILLGQQPAGDAPGSARESWLLALEPVLVRAYMLSSPKGQEQLALQQQLELLVGGNPDRALTLATQLKLQGRNALALTWVNLAVQSSGAWPEDKRNGNLVLAYTLQGQLATQAGLIEEAIAACRSAVAIDPGHFPAQFELSDLLVRLNRYGEALEPTEKALELFDGAGVAASMANAVRGTLQSHLARIQAANSAGPIAPPK